MFYSYDNRIEDYEDLRMPRPSVFLLTVIVFHGVLAISPGVLLVFPSISDHVPSFFIYLYHFSSLFVKIGDI